MHIMKLEFLEKLLFEFYIKIEKCDINLNNIDITDCDNNLINLQMLKNFLKKILKEVNEILK